MKPVKRITNILYLVPAILLAGMSAFLLKEDAFSMWTWYLLVMVLGMAAMPVTGMLFKNFSDRGWMFSKVLAVMASGFLTWFLVSVKILKFTMISCILVTVILIVICLLFYHKQSREGKECLPLDQLKLVYCEEILFLAVFLMWTYIAGFHPAANGNTEKFMDYGFMEAMMRSKTLPATDLWYSSGKINYYYGGQYFAVFLTKLTGTKVKITYNLMRTFVAALAFSLPFSLVWQMVKDRMGAKLSGFRKCFPYVSGFAAGVSLSIAGNMHYVIYAWIIPFIQKLTGQEVDGYWFPDATRYIGFNPVNDADKTIHEFPCYSFVLGDLHAHVVNIMFVLLILGVLYAWMQTVRNHQVDPALLRTKKGWIKELLQPHILLAAILLGMFHMTNYWDFVIYFVVTGGAILFMNLIRIKGRIGWMLLLTAVQAAEVFAVATVVILPFTLQFKTMVSGVAVASNHSLFYQLLVLWGLPAILTIVFIIAVIAAKIRGGCLKKEVLGEENAGAVIQNGLSRLLGSIELPDLFAILMGCCALGLVLIPELVYVRDIYENGNARANTMFKLTYQAYMMFAMTMVYAIWHMLFKCRKIFLKVLAGIGLFFLIWTWGYFGNCIDAWFGNIFDPDQYQGLDAVAYLETDYPEDASAIRWLRANIEGSPVVLEANGDSYTSFERVSAMTGLPTVLGWYVHEWLWRNDVADLNVRSADVETIYTSTDEAAVKELVEEYDISYIFVGSCERTKYGENLNNELIQSLGEIVFKDSVYDTYIVKIS